MDDKQTNEIKHSIYNLHECFVKRRAEPCKRAQIFTIQLKRIVKQIVKRAVVNVIEMNMQKLYEKINFHHMLVEHS